MENQTYTIQRKENRDIRYTDAWLRENGLNANDLAEIALHLQQAQMIATNILKHHGRFLAQNQAHTLNNYLKAFSNKSTRFKITLKQAYTVMNIGTQVNRQLFKQYRKSKKQSIT